MFVVAWPATEPVTVAEDAEPIVDLQLALVALQIYRTPGRVGRALELEGLNGLAEALTLMNQEQRDQLIHSADELALKGIRVLIRGAEDYPPMLNASNQAPPLLFYWGNTDLLYQEGVGMCGARDASPTGLEAARACGMQVAALGMNVISGYARGVDTETHLGALEAGGRTVIVLAEGITRFRQKKAFADVEFDAEKMVVVSQFAPSQIWTVGNAMARNTVIAGLAKALVVVEAGATGGTLNAGLRALQMKRPVYALNFTGGTPAGNQILFEKGAASISSKRELRTALGGLTEAPAGRGRQLNLL